MSLLQVTFAGYLCITPHSNQLQCCVFVHIWFMMRESKMRGRKAACYIDGNAARHADILNEWRQCRQSALTPTAPFTFDPLKRSRRNAQSEASRRDGQINAWTVLSAPISPCSYPREALTEHQLSFHTSTTMAPEDPCWCHHTALAAQDIKRAIYFHYTLFRGLHYWNTFTLATFPSRNISVNIVVAANDWITATSELQLTKNSLWRRKRCPFVICDLITVS